MPKKVEQFLTKYRDIEALLNQLGCEDGFRGAEDWCEKNGKDVDKSYLRMCRNIRNFVVHTPGGMDFFDSDKAMLQYLDDLRKNILGRMDTVGKHLDRKSMCRDTDTAGSALEQMVAKKKTHMLVINHEKHAIDIVSIFDLFQAKTKSTKVATVLKTRKSADLIFVKPDILLADVPTADIVICTKTGDGSSQVMGIVKSI